MPLASSDMWRPIGGCSGGRQGWEHHSFCMQSSEPRAIERLAPCCSAFAVRCSCLVFLLSPRLRLLLSSFVGFLFLSCASLFAVFPALSARSHCWHGGTGFVALSLSLSLSFSL